MRRRSLVLFCFLSFLSTGARACGFPGSPAHSSVTFSTGEIGPGTQAAYTCERGFELLGPARKQCQANGTWTPEGIPFCVINVAAGKAPMQSSTAQGGIPQKAVDGSTSTFFDPQTCSLTEQESSPLWYVNLLEPYMVQLVRLDFGRSCCEDNQPATVVVRVGNNRPDLKINPICNRFTGFLEEGRPLFLPCSPPMPGAFVSVHLEAPAGQMMSICEAFVYTDQALPIERCRRFRDQRPGSTATYNGKCYTFYSDQVGTFADAQNTCEQRGGSLIAETNPALQGFLSWELWRRHRDDPTGQYWMGAVRDPDDTTSWKWITGEPVGVSFWSLPGGNENCARFDGTKDWLWSDTDCQQKMHYICQHKPLACGRPEQPANSSLQAVDFGVGAEVLYSCSEGHLLVGPEHRSCLDTGYYSGYAPTCKRLECGPPAAVAGGTFRLLNGSRGYLSSVRYRCAPDHVLVGRHTLVCDIDQRWNGPPPRCQPVKCDEPPSVLNGAFRLSTNSTVVGTVVEYFCIDDQFVMEGPATIRCLSNGSYDEPPPVCRAGEQHSEPSDVVISYDRPEQNEIPDTVNIRQNSPPGISVPENTLDERITGSRLNIGIVIALGVFGGFVFLAATVTSIIIIAKRHTASGYHTSRRCLPASRRPDARPGGVSSGYSTDSESQRGLNKYYRRAWHNLQQQGAGSASGADVEGQLSEAAADDDAEACRGRHHHQHRRHHHHHHHNHHRNRAQQRAANDRR